MKLYLVKRANYKLASYNLLGVFLSQKKEVVGALAFFRKKDAEEYVKWINSGLSSPIECDIVKVEVKDERKKGGRDENNKT